MGVKNISVQVEDELWRGVRRKTFDEGVTLTEVVQRLLKAYVSGKVETERGSGPAGRDSVARGGQTLPDTPRSVSASPAVKLYARAGCPNRVPQGERCDGCGAVHEP